MSRPAGDPAALAAGARALGAAADAVGGAGGRLRGTLSFVVVAGAWRGPASEAFQAGTGGLQPGLESAAHALDRAAGALAELAGRLGHAQATWDRGGRLAAAAGVALDQHGIARPVHPFDLAQTAAARQAASLMAAAAQEAAAARRSAAARLDDTASRAPAAAARRSGPAPQPGGDGPPKGRRPHRGPGGVGRLAGEALEAGAEVATATHHLVAAAAARARAAARLVETSHDPAVRTAAAKVVDAAGRPLGGGRLLFTLPLIGPTLSLAAGVAEGEPLPRAVVRALGGAIGADVGGRVGLALCGGQAAATEGVGLVACPAITAATGAIGAGVGEAVAARLYDAAADHPEPGPVSPRPG
ncbi:MAG TPA: hypothetical protein VGR68_00260 [Actinomycetota bacterium]|nr:hypothetical protein [Actinomycetota bacterium]